MIGSFIAAGNFSDRIAVITDRGDLLTYSQLHKELNELNSFIACRSLIFCLCENSMGSLIGYCAFLNGGFPAVMLDSSKDWEILRNLLVIYEPNYIWMPKSKLYGFDICEIVYEVYGYVLIKYSDRKCEMPEELALLLTTSGSTGSPKLVRLSRVNILSNAESIANYLEITSTERPITSLPMHYSYGLSVINSHLMKGATILLTDSSVIQKEFWTFAQKEKATSLAGVPYTYEILRRIRLFQMNLPDLKIMTQAGGKLNAEFVQEYICKAEEMGKKFIVMYGQTEATARMSYLPWKWAVEKYRSVGIAIPGGQFALMNSDGQEITESNVDGELVYSGPNVSLGYAECRADLSKSDDNHGVLHTGDIAHRDEDGFYYIVGRIKRFVKIFGNRVSLDATEQLVKTVTSSCACVGVDDKITVFVTDSDKQEEIKAVLLQKTGLNPRAFAIKVVDSIPQNSSGKVQYAELVRLLS